MIAGNGFLDLPDKGPENADLVLLPLPFEGTVSYGKGTAGGHAAILEASRQVETWDEETDFDLDSLAFHWAAEVAPENNEDHGAYLGRVREAALAAKKGGSIIAGVGGEHSISTPLAIAALGKEDLSGLTIVQLDAHADLRDSYSGTEHSHACVMRRLLDRGARVVAIGLRSVSREEVEYGRSTGRWEPWLACHLSKAGKARERLLELLSGLEGDIYLSIDVDSLEVNLSPSTGTPEPGGLRWWQAMEYLRVLLAPSPLRTLTGLDVVETVPSQGSTVNEFTAARLLCKTLAYIHSPAAEREN
ncbi:MAG: agmatinase [Planctomycetota bacterium]|nr:agmatinase [Planctomycetota bacterium]